MNTETVFNNMNKAMFNFSKKLFNPTHKSYYSDVDLQVLNEYHTVIANGMLKSKCKVINPKYINTKTGEISIFMKHSPNRFIDVNVRENKPYFIEVDANKAYTYAFISFNKVPIFNEFDCWKNYSNNDINELTLYIVKVKKKSLFFNKNICLVYGKFFKEFINDVDIIYYKEPSFIFDCDYRSIIDDLYNEKISDDDEEDKQIKKMIANVNFGLMEKTYNKSQQSMVFRNLHEAQYYQGKYGGRLNIIKERDEDDTYNNKYFVLNISEKALLTNGFRFLKELLLQFHNYNMYETFKTLNENDVEVFSVKTDAFTVRKTDVDKVNDLLDIGKDVGQWKINEDFNFPKDNYKIQSCKLIEIPIVNKSLIEIKDEWDMDNIIYEIEKHKKVLIKARYAGSGNTYIANKLREKYKSMCVVSTNNLQQESEGDAMTINKFFGISVGDEKMKAFDYSDCDVIVFDEIYFHNIYFLARILEFVKTTDKIIVATGDENQLESVADITNTHDYDEYINHCIFQIFPKYIYLKECKRIKTEEGKKKLSNIYNDIFVNKIQDKRYLIEKYLGFTDEIKCENNIAYTNETCRTVSGQIRHMKGKKDDYQIGEIVICRKRIKTKNTVFHVNFRYEIVNIHYEDKNDFVELENIKTKQRQATTMYNLRNFFIFAYCYTAHSKQGCSVDGDIVIFDWMRSYASMKWFYTSLTRCRDLDRVKFYKYDVGTEITDYEIDQYLNKKIQGYKKQDRDASREVDDDKYIDITWLRDRMNKCCNNCGEEFLIEKEKGVISSNLTAQRLNNNISHHKNNCKAFCVYCNCSAH